MQKTIYYIILFMLCCINIHASKKAYSSNEDRFQLENPQIILDLSTNTSHIPFIRRGEWKQEKQPIFSANFAIQNSLPKPFLPLQVESAWETARTKVFHTARFTGLTASGLKLLWKFDLHRERPIIRQQIAIHNPTKKAIPVPWYPIFQGNWATPSNKAWIRWWDSLHYTRHQEFLSSTPIKLGSYMQSSDVRYSASNKERPGTLPYWMIGHPRGRILFGLAWTGGWKTTIKGEENSAQIFTHLPEEETQLTLQPGETINGPILHIYCTRETGNSQARKAFMRQRQALAQELYGGPQPSLPLVWNHWYSCRFDFDREYFLKQADAMTPYGFDYFVVDAGWYKGMGEWVPDPQKFKPGELESGLREISDNGIPVGIWSCPQYVSAPDHPHVDDPPFYRKFIGGYLLDMAGMDFSSYVKNHVQNLREQFHIDWWKYDQDFFVPETRHGIMKNVIALQNALNTVRKAEPDLIMENCQSGGRIINEFTSLLSQVHWIKDGGRHGMDHARENIKTGLGSMDLLFPWSCFRWNNNISKMDPNKDELTRYYCRSAMAGLWGISDDLSQIHARQKEVLLEEIHHYRRINSLKVHAVYELLLPKAGEDIAGVVYYNPKRTQAAVLLFRWDGKGKIDRTIPLQIDESKKYLIEDIDDNKAKFRSPSTLNKDGLKVHFKADQLSRLYFIH